MELIEQISNDAHLLGACDKITGRENISEIVSLLFSPQGMEFCVANKFPSLDVFSAFKKHGVDKKGVYINEGKITLSEPKDVCIVGRTNATINLSETNSHRICILHGAEVTINADGYSVTKVECDSDSTFVVNKKGRARVL